VWVDDVAGKNGTCRLGDNLTEHQYRRRGFVIVDSAAPPTLPIGLSSPREVLSIFQSSRWRANRLHSRYAAPSAITSDVPACGKSDSSELELISHA